MKNGISIFNLEIMGKTFQTDVGFDFDELKNTSTEDLVSMKESIVLYLSSKRRKIKNMNYRDLYNRITVELENRNQLKEKIEKDIQDFKCYTFASNFGIQKDVFGFDIKNTVNNLNSTFGVNLPKFPSFLNDKSEKFLNKKREAQKLAKSSKPRVLVKRAKEEFKTETYNYTQNPLEALSCWEYMLGHSMYNYRPFEYDMINIFKTDFQINEIEKFVDDTLFKQPY